VILPHAKNYRGSGILQIEKQLFCSGSRAGCLIRFAGDTPASTVFRSAVMDRRYSKLR
jgi:hypothetical protein